MEKSLGARRSSGGRTTRKTRKSSDEQKASAGTNVDRSPEELEHPEISGEFIDPDEFFSKEKKNGRNERRHKGKQKKSQNKKPGVLKANEEDRKLVADEDFVQGRWFECMPEWIQSEDGTLMAEEEEESAKLLLRKAREVYDKRFSEQASRNASFAHGTIQDQISALTLSIQESPVHHLDELLKLLNYCSKKSARVKHLSVLAFQDLLLNDLLPDKPLRSFQSRTGPRTREGLSKRHMLYAYFESELKKAVSKFFEIVRLESLEGVAHMRTSAISTAYNVLVDKPEGERLLLGIVVNKLGDPERKVATKAIYSLQKLLEKHPAMKSIVLAQVEELVFRKNVKRRTQYYAITFMNQVQFSERDIALSRSMINTYLTLFNKLTLDADEIDLDVYEGRLVASILVGVNRAFPYSNADVDSLYDTSQFEVLFRVSHARSFRSSTQAFALLQQVAAARESLSDRFHRALYAKLSSPELRETKNPSAFLNIVYKAMKNDTKIPRVQAFAKRLLQVALNSSPGFASGSLSIVSKGVLESRAGTLQSFINLPEAENEIEKFVDVETDVDKGGQDQNSGQIPILVDPYDPTSRDPLRCRAEKSSLWELCVLNQHFHPTVKKYAEDLLVKETSIQSSGNPLLDYSLLAFLDRFVYKKPKRHVSVSLHKGRQASEDSRPLANSAGFRKMAEAGEVAEDDKFYLRYFEDRWSRQPDEGDDVDLAGEDEDLHEEEEIDRAFEEALKGEHVMDNGSDDDESSLDQDAFKAAMEEYEKNQPDGQEGDNPMNGMPISDPSDDEELAVDEFEEQLEGQDYEEEQTKSKRKKQKMSVFASADDYTEAVDSIMALEREQMSDEEDEVYGFKRALRPKGGNRKRKRTRVP
eukprot:CAMPEP_0184751602 /NCGR_PEP_ID=MMETSP0315-20130426/43133_1 /TAXON_ID=101924 /ORGANISM="Rhodosorus marinus, Strain UTEX LB 2760" /LENGTH=869 /DNA_ID=CAMNT_0027230875 /DNA_START=122 /DNA_END=2731 /DNA_ORIENTATION=-